MEIALDLVKITAVLIGTLFLGVPVWLKLGGHRSLLFTISLAGVLTYLFRSELPLVTGFTPEVIGGLVVSHVAATGLIAAMMYPTIKARLKARLEKERKA
jgi:hypothetical protein